MEDHCVPSVELTAPCMNSSWFIPLNTIGDTYTCSAIKKLKGESALMPFCSHTLREVIVPPDFFCSQIGKQFLTTCVALKGCRMGRSDKVSLWCVPLLINTRFPFFILE